MGKTTTAINYAWYQAASGRRTLLIDSDNQGSIRVMLNVKAQHFFSDFLLGHFPLQQCVVPAAENLAVLCGNKQTVEAETALARVPSPEAILKNRLEPAESDYDAVVIDVSPSINLVQTCVLMYARNVVIPVNMDLLSLNGASAVYETIRHLNDLRNAHIRLIGLLPCQIDQRLSITGAVQGALKTLSQRFGVPVLPGIRTDQSVNRALLAHQPVLQFDPGARVSIDYKSAFDEVTNLIRENENGTPQNLGSAV